MQLIITHFVTFVVMFIFGSMGGVFFLLYRGVRNRWKNYHPDILVKIGDIMGGILAGLTGFGCLFYANRGEFRFFVLLAVASGFILAFYLLKVVTGYEQ